MLFIFFLVFFLNWVWVGKKTAMFFVLLWFGGPILVSSLINAESFSLARAFQVYWAVLSIPFVLNVIAKQHSFIPSMSSYIAKCKPRYTSLNHNANKNKSDKVS